MSTDKLIFDTYKMQLIRAKKGLTLKALALKSGLTPLTVASTENGKFEPRLTTIKKISEGLDCSIEDLTTRTKIDTNRYKSIPLNTTIKQNNEKESTPLEIAIFDFIEHRKKMRKPMTEKAIELLRLKLDKLGKTDQKKIELLNNSILRGWQGVFPLDNNLISYNSNNNQENVLSENMKAMLLIEKNKCIRENQQAEATRKLVEEMKKYD